VLGVVHFQPHTFNKELIFVFSGSALSRVSERDGLEGFLSKLWSCDGLCCGLLNMPDSAEMVCVGNNPIASY